MENQQFYRYLPGNNVIFHGYLRLPEGTIPTWRCFFHELLLSKICRGRDAAGMDFLATGTVTFRGYQIAKIWIKGVVHSLKLTVCPCLTPENRQTPKMKLVFPLSIFRCELLVSVRVVCSNVQKDLFKGSQVDLDLACCALRIGMMIWRMLLRCWCSQRLLHMCSLSIMWYWGSELRSQGWVVFFVPKWGAPQNPRILKITTGSLSQW